MLNAGNDSYRGEPWGDLWSIPVTEGGQRATLLVNRPYTAQNGRPSTGILVAALRIDRPIFHPVTSILTRLNSLVLLPNSILPTYLLCIYTVYYAVVTIV